MTRPRIFLFNGPPRVGKDTLAGELSHTVKSCKTVKFAEPLKAGCAAFFCGGDRELFNSLDTSEQKDLPHKIFRGMTTREVQIWFSEEVFKPKFGPMIFGELLADEITRRYEQGYFNFFVSDSGFEPEAKFLIDTFKAESLYLVRLQKLGCDFKKNNDSRGYINLDKYDVPSYDVINDHGNIRSMVSVVENIVRDANKH